MSKLPIVDARAMERVLTYLGLQKPASGEVMHSTAMWTAGPRRFLIIPAGIWLGL